MINNIIKAGDKEQFKDISDEILKVEKKKHPEMSDDKIVKELVKRFKGVESKNFMREEYKEVIIQKEQVKLKLKKTLRRTRRFSQRNLGEVANLKR